MKEVFQKILLIEPSELGPSIEARLRESTFANFKVDLVSSLKNAKEKMSETKFDLVLSNLDLPDSGGVFTIKELMKVFQGPLIALSGVHDSLLPKKAFEAGATDFIFVDEIADKGFDRRLSHQLARGGQLRENSAVPELRTIGSTVSDVLSVLDSPCKDLANRIENLRDNLAGKKDFDGDQLRNWLRGVDEEWCRLDGVLGELKEFSHEIRERLGESSDVHENDRRSHFKILVVEDDAEVAESIIERLRRMGFSKIDCAKTGFEALKKCRSIDSKNDRYDVVISDWMMHEMSGFDLLKSLRSHPFYIKVRFLMVTAVDDPEKVKEAANLRLDGYLLKPFTRAEFEKKLRYVTLGVAPRMVAGRT